MTKFLLFIAFLLINFSSKNVKLFEKTFFIFLNIFPVSTDHRDHKNAIPCRVILSFVVKKCWDQTCWMRIYCSILRVRTDVVLKLPHGKSKGHKLAFEIPSVGLPRFRFPGAGHKNRLDAGVSMCRRTINWLVNHEEVQLWSVICIIFYELCIGRNTRAYVR